MPRAAVGTLMRKFDRGPGELRGALRAAHPGLPRAPDGAELPITLAQVLDVNRMVEALKPLEEAPAAQPLRLAGGREGGQP